MFERRDCCGKLACLLKWITVQQAVDQSRRERIAAARQERGGRCGCGCRAGENGGGIPAYALGIIAQSYDVKESFLLAVIKRIPSLLLADTHCLELCGGPNCSKRASLAEFVEKTGVDFLAVAVGTAHGVYKGVPRLDLDRISRIRELVSVPLVLHGTSGVPDDTVRECIARGMCKVNYATDLRIAFTRGVSEYLEKDPNVYDPKKYSALGRGYVKQYVMQKMEVCGSVGRA